VHPTRRGICANKDENSEIKGDLPKEVRQMKTRRPHFLAIGNICFDLVDGERILGGSSAYSAILAHNLGYPAAIATSIGRDFPLDLLPAGVKLYPKFGEQTTTFVNRETRYGRVQFVHAVADPIEPEDIPENWLSARIAYLCPILNDFDPALIDRLDSEVIGLAPQGWLRAVGPDGRVHRKHFAELERVVPQADVVFVSEEDVLEDDLERLIESASILVLTHGKDGADLFWDRGREYRHVSAFLREEVDPTGAGDVFGAAFLLRYQETQDPLESARFAAWAASFVVQGQGTSAIPTKEEVSSYRIEEAELPSF